MKPNKDLYLQCNDGSSGMTAEQFEEVFCQQCKNRECVRASWAFSTWDKRILTQVDRLLLNPNLVRQQDSSKWEGVSDFEVFHEPQTIEVWGQAKEPEPLVLIEEPKPSQSDATIVNLEPSPIPTSPIPTSPIIESSPFNTAPHSISLGGGVPAKPAVKIDPWAVTSEVSVGGKFKMGG